MDISILWTDYTLRTVVLGTVILGIVSGGLGCFAVLRKQSLLGDAISHAALPGIALSFLLAHSKAPWVLLLGAIIAGWCGTLILIGVTHYTNLKHDTMLGIVLSVFFGFGLVLLTFIQKLPIANQAGLNTYLFGNAATILREDLITMGSLGIVAILVLALFWKEFKVITFDPDFAQTMGYPLKRLDVLLTTLIVIAIVIGLQIVGVVLMSAMIIAPASAARQWTDRLDIMLLLASVFGAVSGVIGALISSMVSRLPTGPTIVLVLTVFVVVSLLFAPNRGLVFAWWRHQKNRRQIQEDAMLCNLLLFSESHTDPYHAHDMAALKAIGRGSLSKTMRLLEKKGLVRETQSSYWGFTDKGYQRAQRLSQEGVLC